MNWFGFQYSDMVTILLFLLTYVVTSECYAAPYLSFLVSGPKLTLANANDGTAVHLAPTLLKPYFELNLSMNTNANNGTENHEGTMPVKFYMDSGATQHMCNDLFVMRNCNPTNTDILTGCKNGIVKGTSVGTVLLHSNKQYKTKKPTLLRNTIFAPELRHNIISIKALERNGCSVLFRRGKCSVFDKNDQLIARAWVDHTGLYKVDMKVVSPKSPISLQHAALIMDAKPQNTMDLWHHRLGHASERRIREMVRDGAILSSKINLNDKLSYCESCALAGLTKKSHSHRYSRKRAKAVLERIHTDIAGPYPQARRLTVQ